MIQHTEKLAEFAHDQWVHWMKYLFSQSVVNDDGTVTIPADKARRWAIQVCTLYSRLTEQEKESDRRQAHKMIALLEELSE